MFNISKKTKESVGLDIGSYSVKVVSIVKESGHNILSAYNLKQIPFEAAKTPSQIAKSVKEAMDEMDIHPSEVNLSVSGSNMIVRFISLPKMSKDQLENAMSFEAEKYIPFSADEVIMDFLILDDAEGGQMNVLLAAAKRDFVQSQLGLLEKLGMGINVIDIDAFAVFNAYTFSNKFPADKGTAFLDLGFSQTSVLISTGTIPRFMRLIQIGGKDIIETIAADMSIPQEQAEEMKLKGGEKNGEKVRQVTTAVLDELVKELQLSFGYFENKYGKGVGSIYCSGGMIYQPGTIEYLQEKLGAQLEVWSPLKGLDISESLSREALDPLASQLAVSIGLGLRE